MKMRAAMQILSRRVGANVLACALALAPLGAHAREREPEIESRAVPVLEIGGLHFRDLDRNGALTPFEDWRLSALERARDLVARMSLQEKAAIMVHGGAPTAHPGGMGGEYNFEAARALINGRGVAALVTRADAPAASLAEQHNRFQEMAEQNRFAIPVTLSSDPRNHFFAVIGASSAAETFSQWPDAPGLGAINDPRLTRRFGDIARQEYRAVGIHMALSPMADLATEPRWPRVIGTFGDDPERVGRQVGAYVEGFQNGDRGLNRQSVIVVVKHWVAYGAARDGYDSHSYFGRFADVSAAQFANHVRPFQYAFDARVASVMPTYSILSGLEIDGRPVEQVGAGFSATLIDGQLRGRYGFNGMVLSDSAITEDCRNTCMGEPGAPGQIEIGMPWGVEDLTRVARAARVINAGVDQILGLDEPNVIVQAVEQGLVTQARIDEASVRVLEQKFAIGLFDDPFVDVDAAARIVGQPAFRAAGLEAQRRALVILEARRGVLPLRSGARVFVHGLNADELRRRGFEVTDNLADATIAIVRANAPYQTHFPNFFISRFQHAGDLDFKAGDPALELITQAAARMPVIVDVNLDRPAILTNIRDKAAVLMVNFGASDQALLDVLTGQARARGVLPFELPSSMEAVRAQAEDAPHDSANPLYPSGYRSRR